MSKRSARRWPVAASASLAETPPVRRRAVVPGPVVPDRRDERPREHLPLCERAAHEVPDPVGLVRATCIPVGHPALTDPHHQDVGLLAGLDPYDTEALMARQVALGVEEAGNATAVLRTVPRVSYLPKGAPS